MSTSWFPTARRIAARSAGGIAVGAIRRAAAISKYEANPNFCKECGKKIDIGGRKIAEIRVKKFCNKKCAGKHHGAIGGSVSGRNKRVPRECRSCGTPLPWAANKVRVCSSCRGASRERLMASPKASMHRCSISFNARQVLLKSDRPKSCEKCGYTAHVEACHKRAVADFPDSAIMSEINGLDNLMWLCPNHHWEFDHKDVTRVGGASSLPDSYSGDAGAEPAPATTS